MNEAVTAKVLVEDGELDLAVTTPDETLCINLCYIKIYLPKDAVATPTPTPVPEPTATPSPTPTVAPTEAPAEPTNAPAEDSTSDNTDDQTVTNVSGKNAKGRSALPWVAGGAAILGAIAGIVTYFSKKKKK